MAWVRKDKPIADYVYYDNEVKTFVAKPISALKEADLIRSLANLSLVIFAGESDKLWFHAYEGSKFVVLKSDQLKARGRLGKIPLRKLLSLYVGSILRHGNSNMKYYYQLLNEHNLSAVDIREFEAGARKLRDDIAAAEGDKAVKKTLRKGMVKRIEDFCEELKIRKSNQSSAIPPGVPVNSPPVKP